MTAMVETMTRQGGKAKRGVRCIRCKPLVGSREATNSSASVLVSRFVVVDDADAVDDDNDAGSQRIHRVLRSEQSKSATTKKPPWSKQKARSYLWVVTIGSSKEDGSSPTEKQKKGLLLLSFTAACQRFLKGAPAGSVS